MGLQSVRNTPTLRRRVSRSMADAQRGHPPESRSYEVERSLIPLLKSREDGSATSAARRWVKIVLKKKNNYKPMAPS